MNASQGGPCQGIRNSIAEMRKLGMNNEVVCLDSPSDSFLHQDGFATHCLGPSLGPAHYSAKLVPWLLDNLGRFDIVIVHGIWLYHSYAVRKAMTIARKRTAANGDSQATVPKLFIMPHGMLDPYFQKAKCRRFKAIRNWFYWKFFERKVVNEADGVLFTCQEELCLARSTFYPYTPKKEINVGYGIVAPPLRSAAMRTAFLDKCPEAAQRPYLLFLSRVHEKKGVELLVTAYIKLVRKTVAHLAAQGRKDLLAETPVLVIAGPGSETSYGRRLRQLAKEVPEAAIVFPGMLSREAKWGAFYDCEAFVLPSHQENFGISVVEAMACGKPVLISKQVNIWRQIEAAGGGIIEEDTLPGTLRLLETWCQMTKREQSAMGVRAQTAYIKHFAMGQVINKMLIELSATIERYQLRELAVCN